jgi:uncharacterized protein
LEPRKAGGRTRSINDLKAGMSIEGVVTKVVDYGAFVNIGVEKDGLVHISQLADGFVEDPNVVVSVGDALTLRVLEVDRQRGRISLSGRSGDAPGAERPAGSGRRAQQGKNRKKQPVGQKKPAGRGRDRQPQFKNNPLAALGKLKLDE